MKSINFNGLILACMIALLGLGVSNADAKTHHKHKRTNPIRKGKAHIRAKRRAKKTYAENDGLAKPHPVGTGANLQTDISFSDNTLHGRYQTPDEASVKVENEKVLGDLLAVRTNFKDRLNRSTEQN